MARLKLVDPASDYPSFIAISMSDDLRIEGLVRRIANGGAMLETSQPLRVGDRFRLDIEGYGRTSSSVVWSICPRAGVSFEGHPPLLTPGEQFALDCLRAAPPSAENETLELTGIA